MHRPEPIEIARPTPFRLEWRQGEPSPVWLSCLGLTILLAILVFCLRHASHVGKTVIRCDRPSTALAQAVPKTIRCTRTRTEYWGLISTKPFVVDNVVDASLHEEQQGSVTAYWTMLQVDDGTSIALTIPPPPLGKSRGRESIPVAKEIQDFLQSNASTMESEFSRLDWGVGLILAFHTFVWSGLLIRGIDHCKPVHFSIEIQQPRIELTQISVLWRRKSTHAFSDIYRLQIEEKIYRSHGRYQSKSQIFFRPTLLMASGRPFILAEGLYRSNAETLAALVQSFLQEHLEPQQVPDHIEQPSLPSKYVTLISLPQIPFHGFQTALPNCIFKGHYSQYCSTHLRQINKDSDSRAHQLSQARLATIDQELQSLDFVFLGDLTCEAHPQLYWYAYANEAFSTYALLTPVRRWPILDFYTVFTSNTSVTTSNKWLLWKHLKRQGIYRYSHPGKNPKKLWQSHYQHISEMIQKRQMAPVRVELTLMAIAQAIDHFFVRYEQHFSQ